MSKNRLSEMPACSICVLSLFFLAAGCGGGYGSAPPQPAITFAPNPVAFPATTQGASSTPIVVTVTNTGTGALTISSIAAAGSNPGDFTNTNTCTAAVPAMGTCAISVTFIPTASGPRSETISLTDNAPGSPQVINVSGTANAISLSVTPPVSAIGNSQSLQLSATGDPNGVTWSVIASTSSGPGAQAPPGTIDATGLYTPPPGTPSLIVTVTATSKSDPSKSAFAAVNVVAPGSFTSTNNVQVAQYSVFPAAPANISVQFGLDTSYGLSTWSVPSTPLYVAGMKQSTHYHMRGVIQFADGSSFDDADFTFTTGALPVALVPAATVTTTPGLTPQSGVELLDTVIIADGLGKVPESVVTDLSGNVLWAYAPTLPNGPGPNPVKLLPNGHFLIGFSGQP
ncbi:MAG: choice-of-anchor D domain-containing protein, partial [Candidatus Acidiferrum sp.]